MSDESKPRDEHYERAREAFNDLKVEERALFLVEAFATTLARGIDEAARVVGDELDKVVKNMRERACEKERTEDPQSNLEDPTEMPDA